MWCSLPACALLIRPDRDDAEYLELATRYASSVSLGAPGAEGVLIAPRWVLTSASVAGGLERTSLTLDGRTHAVESVFVSPGPAQAALALVLLRERVAGIAPTPPYRGDDEQGKAVVIVAHGDTGRIGGPASPRDGRRRGGINTVDRISARTFGARIKAGDDASDLQGALAPGETGAAAYLQNDEGLYVAGVAISANPQWNEFARVSAHRDWIDATLLAVARRELDALLDDR